MDYYLILDENMNFFEIVQSASLQTIWWSCFRESMFLNNKQDIENNLYVVITYLLVVLRLDYFVQQILEIADGEVFHGQFSDLSI